MSVNRSATFFRLASSVLTISRRSLIEKQLHCARFFSNTATSCSATQRELSKALQDEIEAEQKLEAENLGGSSSPSIPGFKVSTNDAEVRLTKTHEDEKILVAFSVNHSVDVEDDYETPDHAPVPVALPPFTIEITKGGQRLCFALDLVEMENQQCCSYSFRNLLYANILDDFRVEEFYVAPAAKENDEVVPDTVYASSGKYIDPSLHELLFVRYLEERGFTTDFCHNLVNLATHYEHSQYVNLLENIKNFVSS